MVMMNHRILKYLFSLAITRNADVMERLVGCMFSESRKKRVKQDVFDGCTACLGGITPNGAKQLRRVVDRYGDAILNGTGRRRIGS